METVGVTKMCIEVGINVPSAVFATCMDGKCYNEVRDGGQEIEVPRGCKNFYMRCAQECSKDERCKAFTFKNTNGWFNYLSIQYRQSLNL